MSTTTTAPRRAAVNADLYLTKVGDNYHFRRAHIVAGARRIEKFSLKTSDLRLARLKRDAHLRAAHGRELDELLGRRKPVAIATLGQILDAYDLHTHTITRETVRMNCAALLRVVMRGLDLDRAAALRLPLDRLDATVVMRFQNATLREAGADYLKKASAGTTVNSAMTKARAVFTRREIFTKAICGTDLHIPPLDAFLGADRITDTTDTRFRPFTADEGVKLLSGLEDLARTHPRLELAAQLMFRCGFRNAEAAHFNLEWLERRADGTTWALIRRYAYFEPKGTLREVPVPDEILAKIDTLVAAHGRADGFLVAPDSRAWEREAVTLRELPDWVKTTLPSRRAYDLRKHAGSMIAREQGMHAAQKFLGHASITTTEKYYAGLITTLKPTVVSFIGSGSHAPETHEAKKKRLLEELAALENETAA